MVEKEIEFRERIRRIEGLVRRLETMADPELRSTARELMESVMDLSVGCWDRWGWATSCKALFPTSSAT